MRKTAFIVTGTVLFLILNLTVLSAFANTMTRGFVSEIRRDRITVVPEDGGRQSFRINTATQIIKLGVEDKGAKIVPHSIVQVIANDGVALQIVVVEVPR